MRQMSDAYRRLADNNTRMYKLYLDVYKKNDSGYSSSAVTYTSDESILGLSLTVGQTSGNTFQLGKTYCPVLNFALKTGCDVSLGDKVQMRVSFGGQSLGVIATAYVDTVSYATSQVNYEAYGKMMQLNKYYVSDLSYPNTFSNMVSEICTQSGLSFDTFDWVIDAHLIDPPIFGTDDNGNPAYLSKRDMLGAIAGVNASNVILDPETENVKFVKYSDTGESISYENTISRTIIGDSFSVSRVDLINSGRANGNDPGVVPIYFPLQTEEGLTVCMSMASIELSGMSTIGMVIQIQGKGYYELGDIITYNDIDGKSYDFAVMGIKYSFVGGFFTESLYSFAPTSQENEYSGDVRYTSGVGALSKTVSSGAVNSATKLVSPDGNSWASVQDAGNITLFENNSDMPWGYITPNHTGISLGTTDGRYVTLLSNTIDIYCTGNRVFLSGLGDDGTINLSSGNVKLNVNGGAIVTITSGGINITGSNGISSMIVKGVYNDYGNAQGFQIKCGSYALEAKSNGLYYNGVKLATETTEKS